MSQYDRLHAEWLTNGRTIPRRVSGAGSDISVNELLEAYLLHADAYYVKNGKPTSEPSNIRLAFRPIKQLYGETPAGDFGPLQLEAARQTIIGTGVCFEGEVNRRVRLIVGAFKWAVAKAMVPPSLHHGLQAVAGPSVAGDATSVSRSRSGPVPEAFVEAVQPVRMPTGLGDD